MGKQKKQQQQQSKESSSSSKTNSKTTTTTVSSSTSTPSSTSTSSLLSSSLTIQLLLSTMYDIGIITYTYWYGLYYYSYGKGRYEPFTSVSSSISNADSSNVDSSMMKLPSRLVQIIIAMQKMNMNMNMNESNSNSNTDPNSKEQQQQVQQVQQQVQLQQQEQMIRIHIYLLVCNLYLYNKIHYRKSTYVQDIQDNLYNIAIPGTGIRLSYMIHTSTSIGYYCITIPFIILLYPIIAIIASIHLWYNTTTTRTSGMNSNKDNSTTSTTNLITQEYMIRLLSPNDWFTYWRYNSVLVAYHAYINQVTAITTNDTDTNSNTNNNNNNYIAKEYEIENKWTFLQRGDANHIAISPYLKTPLSLVIKHKNEEGGMGIYFYNNAISTTLPNNDWIIQERIYNSNWVSSLLPKNAPLSTFRIITCSRGAMKDTYNSNSNTTNTTNTTNTVQPHDIIALSCVFRAGRDNASTDHNAIFFNVDIQTGIIGGGTTNQHWYQIGNIYTTKWRTYEYERTNVHPDGNIPVAGQVVSNIQDMVSLVNHAHYILCPHVPFCGWDIVLSSNPNIPICLLEVNLSCNFFRGTFDTKLYFDYMNDVIVHLHNQRIQMEQQQQLEQKQDVVSNNNNSNKNKKNE